MLIVLGDDHEYMRKLDKILEEVKETKHLLIKQNENTMATLADITASLDALDAAVAAIPTGTAPGGISATDADGIKARIDADTTALQGKVTPPAPTV